MLGFARKISFLLVGLLLILESRKCSGLDVTSDKKWWETTLVYEIWPSSYQDSDGDGIGDLQGIINRLDYIDDLGVETICLNPIYPSPLVDSGYDVSDYNDVHPIFGNLSDFDELLEQAHARGIKVILDVVPNHTSDKHKWFNASIYKIDPFTDYYIWVDGSEDTENGTTGPPNNWISAWRNEQNSAWTYNEERNQWYYHRFHESEPDLNLDNANVRDEILLILDWWLERGVDGFRITGIPFFYEDPELRDEPSPSDQIYTVGQPKNVHFLYNIRTFVDGWTESHNSTSKYLISGSYDTDDNLLSYYGTDNTSGIVPLNYRFITNVDIANANASEVETTIKQWLDLIPWNASTNWALSNHDTWRIASRAGSDRLDALHMLSMLLPGQAFTYYGDEIGMLDTPISSKDDEEWINDSRKPNDHDDNYRYSVRSSMQWYDSPTSANFSASTVTPFDPLDMNYVDINVEEQLDNPRSHLNVYKRIAELRKDPVFVHGDWELQTLNDDILVLRRTLTDHPVYVVVINLANITERVNITELYPDLNEDLEVVVTSGTDDTERTAVPRSDFHILPSAGLVLKSEQNDAQDSEDVPLGSEEEMNEMENTTDYINMTTMNIITATTTSFNNTETTIDSITEVSVSLTTEISELDNIFPKASEFPSAGNDKLRANLKLETSVIFGIVILAGAW